MANNERAIDDTKLTPSPVHVRGMVRVGGPDGPPIQGDGPPIESAKSSKTNLKLAGGYTVIRLSLGTELNLSTALAGDGLLGAIWRYWGYLRGYLSTMPV